jgi:hypothetical protein
VDHLRALPGFFFAGSAGVVSGAGFFFGGFAGVPAGGALVLPLPGFFFGLVGWFATRFFSPLGGVFVRAERRLPGRFPRCPTPAVFRVAAD